MPGYEYASNRFLTAVQNLQLCYKRSEYHTGFRASSQHRRFSCQMYLGRALAYEPQPDEAWGAVDVFKKK
jgi:hypothetical protein